MKMRLIYMRLMNQEKSKLDLEDMKIKEMLLKTSFVKC